MQSGEIQPRTGAEETEELAHAISHDLAQPLTTISGFARLLASRYEFDFDDEAREQLNSIAERATDMQGMIDEVVTSLRAPAVTPSTAAAQPGPRHAVAA